jgi:hypothetical protein
VTRTWAIWLGIGDYESQNMDLVGYQQSGVDVYTDLTSSSATGQPYIDSISYVDKHPQPSEEGPNGTLPTVLQDFYGNISLETAKSIALFHQTGDLHIATYDYSARVMYVSIGRIGGNGDYKPDGGSDGNVWKAYNRPYLKFNLDDLWNGR